MKPSSIRLFFALFSVLSCSTELYYAEDDNVVLEGKPSHLFSASMERGALLNNGYIDASIDSYNDWERTAFFIMTNGATALAFEEKSGLNIVFQYDEEYHLISRKDILKKIELDGRCVYVKFQRSGVGNQCCNIRLYEGYTAPQESKLVQQQMTHERIVFSVIDDVCTTALLMLPPNYNVAGEKVPLILWDSGDGSFRDWYNYEGGTYEGRQIGLRYLCDQGFAVLEIYSWGSYYYKKYPGCGERSAMPIPIHLATHEKGVEYVTSRYNIDPEQVFEISKSGSGKISLYWAMYKPRFNLKAIYAFAPVFDDLNFLGWGMKDYRNALYEELKLRGTDKEVSDFLNGTPYDYDVQYKKEHNLDITLKQSWQMHKSLGRSFIAKNTEAFKHVSVDWLGVHGTTVEELMECTHNYSEEFWEGYNRHYDPKTQSFFFSWDDRGLPETKSDTYTRYDLKRTWSGVPFTVIMSPTDEQTPYWNALEVVKQFQNGGADVNMITLKSGGHSGPDLSIGGETSVSDVTTRLGTHYDVVSIGWYLAVEDIFTKYLSNN